MSRERDVIFLEMKEKKREKNISTKKYCEKACPWFQSENEHKRRTVNPEKTACKRAETLNGVMGN